MYGRRAPGGGGRSERGVTGEGGRKEGDGSGGVRGKQAWGKGAWGPERGASLLPQFPGRVIRATEGGCKTVWGDGKKQHRGIMQVALEIKKFKSKRLHGTFR